MSFGTYHQPTDCARQALLQMRLRNIPPEPNNYLVWYHVAADDKPDLSLFVRRLDDEGTVFDEQINHQIFERFFGQEADHQHLMLIRNRVEAHLTSIGSLLGQVFDGTQHYGDRLEGFATALANDERLGDVGQVLNTLRDDTRTILDRVDGWGGVVMEQADEVAKLRNDLDAARLEAETDSMTRIGNRKRLERRFSELALAACADETPLSLILFDIDHFKSFNDTYGHTVGDRVLKVVVARIVEMAPPGIELFRYGGEEFAILAPNCALKDALDVAEMIRKSVAALRIARKRDHEVLRRITISLGVGQHEPSEPLQRLIDRADGALYAAKNGGRNCTCAKPLAAPQLA